MRTFGFAAPSVVETASPPRMKRASIAKVSANKQIAQYAADCTRFQNPTIFWKEKNEKKGERKVVRRR